MALHARLLLSIAAVSGLAACAVSHQVVSGPNGKPAYVMKCSGYMRDRQDCLAEAGRLCPAGYTLVDDSSRFAGAVVSGNVIIPAHRDYMTISCK